jgi:hypothetical protein
MMDATGIRFYVSLFLRNEFWCPILHTRIRTPSPSPSKKNLEKLLDLARAK